MPVRNISHLNSGILAIDIGVAYSVSGCRQCSTARSAPNTTHSSNWHRSSSTGNLKKQHPKNRFFVRFLSFLFVYFQLTFLIFLLHHSSTANFKAVQRVESSAMQQGDQGLPSAVGDENAGTSSSLEPRTRPSAEKFVVWNTLTITDRYVSR